MTWMGDVLFETRRILGTREHLQVFLETLHGPPETCVPHVPHGVRRGQLALRVARNGSANGLMAAIAPPPPGRPRRRAPRLPGIDVWAAREMQELQIPTWER